MIRCYVILSYEYLNFKILFTRISVMKNRISEARINVVWLYSDQSLAEVADGMESNQSRIIYYIYQRYKSGPRVGLVSVVWTAWPGDHFASLRVWIV